MASYHLLLKIDEDDARALWHAIECYLAQNGGEPSARNSCLINLQAFIESEGNDQFKRW